MSSKTDEMKGRAKEAAGVLTDDEKLQREGNTTRPRATSSRRSTMLPTGPRTRSTT